MPARTLTAQAVADLVGGRLLGDGGVRLNRIGPLDRAGPEALSFLVSARYLPYFRSARAGAVLLPQDLAAEPEGPATRIVVGNPYQALIAVIPAMFPETPAVSGVDPTAVVGEGAVLAADVSVGPGAVIGPGARIGTGTRIDPGAVIGEGVVIGDGCRVGPRVVCYPGTRLGHRVVLKAGAVIGGRGFGYVPGPEGHQPIPHVGACVLEDDVEIGSNTCVDRGSVDDTVIGQGTKIDNLVHIAHNCRIGRRTLIMACTGVAGTTRIGDEVMVLGHVGISDHITIGDRARISAKSVVFGNVPAGATYGGYPARPHRQFLRTQAALGRLAGMAKEIESLVERARVQKDD
ncbi:MAG: UDP-3-O-(3-hydroxymyristoyl)glucosamine N-acyltransferase [Gemmatimonadales bacterium]